jgi:hypothetical protein
MKQITILLVFLAAGSLCSLAGPIEEPSFTAISNYYARVFPRLLPKDVPFETNRQEPLPADMIQEVDSIVSIRGRVFESSYERAPLFMVVNRKTAEVFLLANHRLEKHIDTNTVQKIPTLTIPEAVSQAKRYLADLEISLPTNCFVQSAQFGINQHSRWRVTWGVEAGGYSYEESATEEQTMVVVFHEKHGFCSYGQTIHAPPPKSTEVKVSKEDAIARASKVAPLVMQTPFYRSARASGFKVNGVRKAELKLFAPNWLLDPARAVWIWEKPPKETRLCWVVTFSTRDTVDRGKTRLFPVDILVYVDAISGEVVGANFT